LKGRSSAGEGALSLSAGLWTAIIQKLRGNVAKDKMADVSLCHFYLALLLP
jgi:hypothetical protein